MKKIVIVLAVMLISALSADAQKWSISTNVIDWANFGTVNGEVGVAVSQHWSVMAGARYNPWTFKAGDQQTQFQNRKQSYHIGARVWPWHIYSGWWFSAQAQYQEYNRGGIINRDTEEGDAVGLGLSLGYTLMVHKRFNLEFGVGGWGGYKWYTKFMCPVCGRITETGEKFFVMPNDLRVSLMYIF